MKPFQTLTQRGQLGRLRSLAKQALQGYDLEPLQLTALDHGDNTTFRVDTAGGERFVLRIHRPTGKTSEQVHSEMVWLNHLNQTSDLRVPEPVPRRDGFYVAEFSVPGVPNPRMCVLLRWVPGRFINDGLRVSHLERAGEFLAQLQLSAAQFVPPDGFVRGQLDHLCGKPNGTSLESVRQQVDNPEDEARAVRWVSEFCSPKDGRTVEQILAKLRAAQRQIGFGPEDFGLIHGDFHQWNYLFHRGQARAIDFDDCGFGHYLYDLEVSLSRILRHPIKEGKMEIRESSFFAKNGAIQADCSSFLCQNRHVRAHW